MRLKIFPRRSSCNRLAETKLPKLDSGDLGGWNDWIIAHSLMREARILIEGQPAAVSDQPKQK
jgi:hypothetical protein